MSEKRVEAQVIGATSPGLIRVRLGQREQDVPADRIPPEFRMPNSQFVAVIQGGEFIRVESSSRPWIEIQNKIRVVLNQDWDPIGVADAVDDEYDNYIGSIYSLLLHNVSLDDLAAHLQRIEREWMDIPDSPVARRIQIAQRLKALELPKLEQRKR